MGEKSSTRCVSKSVVPFVLRRVGDGAVVAARVRVAAGVLSRWRGLLWAPRLQAGEALWLEPCNGIHTFGMGYSIAVVTLNADRIVVGIERDVRPCKIVWPVSGGRIVVEVLPETLQSACLTVGDRLVMERQW